LKETRTVDENDRLLEGGLGRSKQASKQATNQRLTRTLLAVEKFNPLIWWIENIAFLTCLIATGTFSKLSMEQIWML